MPKKVTKIRLTKDELEEAGVPEENAPKIIRETPKQRDQRLFASGNRKTRRMVAKRNGFYKDRSGEAWRESNKMIKRDEGTEL